MKTEEIGPGEEDVYAELARRAADLKQLRSLLEVTLLSKEVPEHPRMSLFEALSKSSCVRRSGWSHSMFIVFDPNVRAGIILHDPRPGEHSQSIFGVFHFYIKDAHGRMHQEISHSDHGVTTYKPAVPVYQVHIKNWQPSMADLMTPDWEPYTGGEK